MVAEQRGRVVAAAHLLRCAADGQVGDSYRDSACCTATAANPCLSNIETAPEVETLPKPPHAGGTGPIPATCMAPSVAPLPCVLLATGEASTIPAPWLRIASRGSSSLGPY